MLKRIAQKVLVIGWGSADWKVIDPLLKKQLLPNVAKLLETGSRATLGSIDPPVIPSNWVSALTSKAPVKHNIFNFIEPGENANYQVTSLKRSAKFLWEILSDNQLKAHQVGAPASYPANEINGISISDLFFEKNDLAEKENLIYPSSQFDAFITLKAKALELAENTYKSWDIKDISNEKRYDDLISVIKDFLKHIYQVHLSALQILKNNEWDNANIFFSRLSNVVFTFTRYHLPKNKDLPKQLHQTFKEVLAKSYQLLDGLLGEILNIIPEETTVLLFSQSGYLPFHSYIQKLDKSHSTFEFNTPGMLILKGRKAFKREELFAVNSLDICSTVLVLLGLPFAKDMDGKVLLGHQFFTKINEPIETYEQDNPADSKAMLKPIEVQDYEEQLKRLGYITADLTDKQQYFEVRAKITSGKQQEVIKFLEEQWKKHPKNSWIGGRLAGCYLATNQIEKAKELLDKVLALGDEISELHLLKGNMLMLEMKYRSASKQYEIAEKSIGHIPNLYSQIGEAYGKMNQHHLAQQYLEKEIKINPHPSSYIALASTFLQRKMMAKAIDPLQKALDMAPQIPGTWFQLGNCKMQTQDYEGAAEAFEQAKK